MRENWCQDEPPDNRFGTLDRASLLLLRRITEDVQDDGPVRAIWGEFNVLVSRCLCPKREKEPAADTLSKTQKKETIYTVFCYLAGENLPQLYATCWEIAENGTVIDRASIPGMIGRTESAAGVREVNDTQLLPSQIDLEDLLAAFPVQQTLSTEWN